MDGAVRRVDHEHRVGRLDERGVLGQEYKVSIRNIRRDTNETLKRLKKDGEISEDDFFRAQDRVQTITNEYIELVDRTCQEKEKEILEF